MSKNCLVIVYSPYQWTYYHYKGSDDLVKITVNETLRTVSFWLCSDEKCDDAQISNIFNTLKKDNKYRKLIYVSGTGDLLFNTRELIRANQG